jgi:hypothetical protein
MNSQKISKKKRTLSSIFLIITLLIITILTFGVLGGFCLMVFRHSETNEINIYEPNIMADKTKELLIYMLIRDSGPETMRSVGKTYTNLNIYGSVGWCDYKFIYLNDPPDLTNWKLFLDARNTKSKNVLILYWQLYDEYLTKTYGSIDFNNIKNYIQSHITDLLVPVISSGFSGCLSSWPIGRDFIADQILYRTILQISLFGEEKDYIYNGLGGALSTLNYVISGSLKSFPDLNTFQIQITDKHVNNVWLIALDLLEVYSIEKYGISIKSYDKDLNSSDTINNWPFVEYLRNLYTTPPRK